MVQEAVEFARALARARPRDRQRHVFADPLNPPDALRHRAARPTAETGWLDAVRDGIAEEMRRDPHIIYFGEGTGERGGTFAHTKGLWQEFGADRMIDTPISELGFTGAALGASATGVRCIADLMFADFMFEAAGQIVAAGREAALHEQRPDERADGRPRRRRRGAQRRPASQRHVSSGLGACPRPDRLRAVDAGRRQGPDEDGAARRRPGASCWRPRRCSPARARCRTASISCRSASPASRAPGTDLTIAAAGQLVHRALEAAEPLAARRHLLRGDRPAHDPCRSMSTRSPTACARPHRLLVVDEGYAMCGVGAELGQAMNELAFDELDAPVGAPAHRAGDRTRSRPRSSARCWSIAERIVARRGAADGIAGADRPRRRRARTGTRRAARPRRAPAPHRLPRAKHATPAAGPDGSRVEGEPITMPFGDLTVSEGKLVRWLKREGDAVKRGRAWSPRSRPTRRWSRSRRPQPACSRSVLEPEGTVVKMGQQSAS